MQTADLSALTLDNQLSTEWLAVNHLGGYAASTLPGCNTRKYHGLLVAALTPPVRRMVLLSRVEETLYYDGWPQALATNEYPDTVAPVGYKLLRAFSNEPFPRWAFQNEGWTLEKELRLLHGENTVLLSYTLQGSAKPVDLEIRPLFALRGIHELMFQWNGNLMPQTVEGAGSAAAEANSGNGAGGKSGDGAGTGEATSTLHHIPATHRTPEVFFAHDGKFKPEGYWYLNTIYRREPERGYSGLEDLWSPAAIRYRLPPGQTVHFACSTDPIDLKRVIAAADRQYAGAGVPAVTGVAADSDLVALSSAAEQFVVKAREGQTMVTGGYPWSPPDGRDAMIAAPGLLMVTGRLAEARSLLEYFAGLVHKGLMPSEFPTDGTPPRYTAADTSLWFINAVREYMRYSADEQTGRKLFDVIDEILTTYARGTLLGIRADHEGLLMMGSPGTPVTWMNAQVGEAAITSRHGRPVEVNALWYNALRIGADLARRFHLPVRGEELYTLANRARHAFNANFWNEQTGCCFDVVGDGGNDPAVRPNQVLAVSLPYPVLDALKHDAVLSRIREDLLTPYGLRTLSPRDANYRGRYGGPIHARDRAYHQGSAFPWLLGPFVTAFTRVYGRGPSVRREAAGMLRACLDHLRGRGCGQIHELFDGDAPHYAGGLTASARSVAEILRAYAEDVLDLGPVLDNHQSFASNAQMPQEPLQLL